MSSESLQSVTSQPQPAQGPQSDLQSPSAPHSEVSSSETHLSPLTPVPSGAILHKIVLIVVVAGIIVFAVFQLLQCVTSYANPVTKSTVLNLTRTFPGLMICPFSDNMMPAKNNCPQWSSDAYLSYDFNDYDTSSSSNDYGNPTIARSCPLPLVVFLDNTNSYGGSNSKRTRFTCKANALPNFFGGTPLGFGSNVDTGDGPLCFIGSHRFVTVKNTAKPVPWGSDIQGETIACNSMTPPNVRCLVFDPSYFGTQLCNPMVEDEANAENSLRLKFQTRERRYSGANSVNSFFPTHPVYKGLKKFFRGVFSYSGLKPPISSSNLSPQQICTDINRNLFINAPPSLSASTSDLFDQAPVSFSACSNANLTIFGGLTVVLYDASKGIPNELNFDGAKINSMSSSVLGSSVLMSTSAAGDEAADAGVSAGCAIRIAAPLEAKVTTQIDAFFTNAVLNQEMNKTTQTVTIQHSVMDQSTILFDLGSKWILSIAFSSSSTVVTNQVIPITILTTISIIVSTAGTLWGSREKMKDGIHLAMTMGKAYLEKIRAPKSNAILPS